MRCDRWEGASVEREVRERNEEWIEGELTGSVIGAAIEVHRELGPGLLESIYQRCLELELARRGIPNRVEVAVPVRYREFELGCGHRIDLVVADRVAIELKAVEVLLPVHSAQLLTYLRLSNIPVGLLINFNSPRLVDGIRRFLLPSPHR